MPLSHDQIGANIASLAGRSLPEALAQCAAAGLGSVELLGFDRARHSQGNLPGVHHDELDAADREGLRSLTAPFARRAVHAPFIDIALISHNAAVVAFAESQVAESIRLAALIGGGPVVVHPNAKRGFDPAEYRQDSIDVFRRLGDAAQTAGAVIAVENMPDVVPETADRFCALIWNIGHDAVGACLDTGHVLGMVPATLRRTPEGAAMLSATAAEVARTLGPKLVHVHIHDVRAFDWRDHREVGTGIIDYGPLFGALHDIGYSGALSLEMEEPDRAGAMARSAERIRGFIDTANRKDV